MRISYVSTWICLLLLDTALLGVIVSAEPQTLKFSFKELDHERAAFWSSLIDPEADPGKWAVLSDPFDIEAPRDHTLKVTFRIFSPLQLAYYKFMTEIAVDCYTSEEGRRWVRGYSGNDFDGEDKQLLIAYIAFVTPLPQGKYPCKLRLIFRPNLGRFTISPEKSNPFAKFVDEIQARVEVISVRSVPPPSLRRFSPRGG